MLAHFKMDVSITNLGSAPVTGTAIGTSYTTNNANVPNTAIQFAGNTSSYIDFVDNGDLDFPSGTNFTISFLFYFNGTSTSGLIDNCLNYGGWGVWLWSTVSGVWNMQFNYKNGSVGSSAATAFTLNQWHHVAAVRNNGTISIYIDGVFRLSAAEGTTTPSYPLNMIAGAMAWGGFNPPRYNPFNGKLDEFRIYNRALTQSEIDQLQCAFVLPSTPTITAGGAITFCLGGSVTLTSNAASGNQWYKDGIAIGGATATTLIVTTSGSYTTIVTSGGCQSAASNAIVVTVNTAPPTPVITAGGAITFCQGGNVTLTSNAPSGNQWYKDGIVIGGATATTLIVTTSGSYTTIVTLSGCVSAASNAIIITVNSIPPTPVITAGGAITFCQGGSVTLTSNAASGNQWYKDGIIIGGSTATTLIVTTSGSYTTIVTSGGCQSAASNAIIITVNSIPPTPVITASGAITFCQGGSVTLTSNAASGNQWYKDGIAIGGSTATTLNVTASGSYTVKVTLSGCESAASNAIIVTVNSIPPTPVITAGGSITFCQGGSVTLTSNAPNGNQWYKDAIAIGGATATTLIVTTSGSYTTIVTSGGCPSAASNAIVVTVNPIPPTPTITATGNILQSSAVSGNQWFLNSVSISGATSQLYTVQASGLYTVQVTLNGCSSISAVFNFVATGIVNPSAWNYDVVVFPNPVNDNLYITNHSNRKLDIRLTDINGKIALHYYLNVTNGSVNMEKLARGVYLVSITDKQKNETIHKLIIKQ